MVILNPAFSITPTVAPFQSLPYFFSPTYQKTKYHNFHLSESCFTCPRLPASGLNLVRRLPFQSFIFFLLPLRNVKVPYKFDPFYRVLKIYVISGCQLPVTEASVDKTTYCDEFFLYNM